MEVIADTERRVALGQRRAFNLKSRAAGTALVSDRPWLRFLRGDLGLQGRSATIGRVKTDTEAVAMPRRVVAVVPLETPAHLSALRAVGFRPVAKAIIPGRSSEGSLLCPRQDSNLQSTA